MHKSWVILLSGVTCQNINSYPNTLLILLVLIQSRWTVRVGLSLYSHNSITVLLLLLLYLISYRVRDNKTRWKMMSWKVIKVIQVSNTYAYNIVYYIITSSKSIFLRFYLIKYYLLIQVFSDHLYAAAVSIQSIEVQRRSTFIHNIITIYYNKLTFNGARQVYCRAGEKKYATTLDILLWLFRRRRRKDVAKSQWLKQKKKKNWKFKLNDLKILIHNSTVGLRVHYVVGRETMSCP